MEPGSPPPPPPRPSWPLSAAIGETLDPCPYSPPTWGSCRETPKAFFHSPHLTKQWCTAAWPRLQRDPATLLPQSGHTGSNSPLPGPDRCEGRDPGALPLQHLSPQQGCGVLWGQGWGDRRGRNSLSPPTTRLPAGLEPEAVTE